MERDIRKAKGRKWETMKGEVNWQRRMKLET
jgi:hypothetical protein